MNRIAAALSIALISATAAGATEFGTADVPVTRTEPAQIVLVPSDRILFDGEQVSVTFGSTVDVGAQTILSARDRALQGVGADETVTATVFPGGAAGGVDLTQGAAGIR